MNLSNLTQQSPAAASEDERVLSIDDVLNSFKTETDRQEFYQPKEPVSEDGTIDPRLINPEPEADFEAEKEVDPEKVGRTGQRIARMIDTGFNFVASSFIAKDSDKDYTADDDDLADLGDAWGEIAAEKGWTMSPRWQLALLYAIIYGPLLKEAFSDRKMAEMEKKQNDLEEKQRNYEREQLEQRERIEQLQAQIRKADGE